VYVLTLTPFVAFSIGTFRLDYEYEIEYEIEYENEKVVRNRTYAQA
jgi:hypothetical protein